MALIELDRHSDLLLQADRTLMLILSMNLVFGFIADR
jgi:hypothetical protein